MRNPEPSAWPPHVPGLVALAIAVSAVVALGATCRSLLGADTTPQPISKIEITGRMVTTGDSWTERLSDPGAWRGGRYVGGRGYRRPHRGEEASSEWTESDGSRLDEDAMRTRPGWNPYGTYRTVCVRLCDGYFFPISFATTPEYFGRDEAACRSSCRTSARLYVYPNPGGEPEQMVSLEGRPYSALPSAFLFRTKYDAACACKPHPWEPEALARHRALAEAQRKGGRQAATVARTIRMDARHADAATPADTGESQRARPEGAMLLGVERPGAGSQRQTEPPRIQRGGRYGRRRDWQSRAFGGF